MRQLLRNLRTLLGGLIVGAVIAILGLFALPYLAAAASDQPPPTGIDAGADALFELDATVVAILLGTVIPILNGLVTKLTTSSAVKAVITLVLSALAGLLTTATTEGGDSVFSEALVLNSALSFLFAIATYAGVWKPLQVTSSPVTVTDQTGQQVTVPGRLATVGVK
jgi:hypothetical protein